MGPPSQPAAAVGVKGGRPRWEVADVVRQYGDGFLGSHGASGEGRRVLRAIASCRTAALGGHVEGCRECGHRRIAYNSCRNRHCPKCQGKERARWMAGEAATLLPVDYFHVVFTLPHALHPLLRLNRGRLYGLLFHAASATLCELARDPRHLGAEPSITMVLHTWGQDLRQHVHVHCVVSAGGLSRSGDRWRATRRHGFLFPVRVMSKLFRGKYLAGLDHARNARQLRLECPSDASGDDLDWKRRLAELRAVDWVVYAKPPFGGPDRVLKYLSRYTHRVAISNRRILSVDQGLVRFACKDYAHGGAQRIVSLRAPEFLRRFLLHVLPRGFVRIRHYGILANRHRQRKLAQCRALLTVPPTSSANRSTSPVPVDPTSPHSGRCPSCGGPLYLLELIPPRPEDTS